LVDQEINGMRAAIWWIRRDLRLTDNQALTAAMQAAEDVIPLFILDPYLWNADHVGEKRLAFLSNGLLELDRSLRQRGSRLFLHHGKPEQVLQAVLDETGAEAVFAEEDYSPYARRRDERVARQLSLNLLPGLTIHHPLEIRKSGGGAYTVYTPFMRAWKARPLPKIAHALPAPDQITTRLSFNSNADTSHLRPEVQIPFEAGEHIAQQKLRSFVDGDDPLVYRYRLLRNRPDLQGTSGLSPYLRFGMLSARQVVVSVIASILETPDAESEQSANIWLDELIWREFYQSILYHFPSVLHHSFREKYRTLKWSNAVRDFAAWKQGQTGYPLVDAGMRQLQETGWIHNRVRMVVASFLTKNLLIDWRWGEKWFMQNLVDGDPASNNGGWQWTAGTGTDAAPYFRIFNPVTQSQKFDPEGVFIRRWVPELREVPPEYIHEPWKMPLPLQRKIGCILGVKYPRPIVEIAWSRQRALDVFGQVKHQAVIQGA
jgi:deoxyribodipyrimidine photo-lyase